MRLDDFAERADRIESISGDHEKTEEVATLLNGVEGDEVCVVARFVQGRVFPAWDDTKLDVGPALLYEALALASGKSTDEIEESVAETGGVGEAAATLNLGGQQTFGATAKTISDAHDALRRVAEGEGEGSEERKARELGNLFMDAPPRTAKYLARLVLGEMRLGVGEGTVRDAIAEAFDVDVSLVERGLMVTNDAGEVARVARDEGEDGLGSLEMRLGRPVKPMLAQAGDPDDVFEELGVDEAVVEWKYDGARLQVHVGEETRLFSRSLEDLTESLPDVVERIEADSDEGVILDAEVVAVRDDEPLPFQDVLRRLRRKHHVDEMREEVALEIHVFDVLYDDGAVIDEPLRQRRARLDSIVDDTRARGRTVSGTDAVVEELRKAVEEGHEGVMAKNPESAYTPGSRGGDWLKLKPDPETLDLVVTAGEWGEGRRANLIGSYLLSARSDDGYETAGKVATGLTDERLEELTETFEDLVVSEDGKELEFAPEVVFEVGYEEIQPSPVYSSGYALRFPRFVRVRDDKSAEEADTVERVERLYEDDDG